MNEFIFITGIFLFLATIVLTERAFYHLAMKLTEMHFEKKYGYSIVSMSFSFEQMVYLVKLPSNSPIFREAKKEQLSIDYDYSSYMFPNIRGISVNIKSDQDQVTLAYLPIESYRSPVLDKLLKEGTINLGTYRKISTCKIRHPKMKEIIIEEVFRKLQVGRYEKLKKS